MSSLLRVVFDPDTIPPGTPTILSVVAVGQNRLDITWTPVVDTGGSGLAGYDLLKDGATVIQLGVQTIYSDTGLTAASSHTYRVRSRDAATPIANTSPYSTQVGGATAAAPAVFNPDYPRRASYAIGGTQNASNASLAERCLNIFSYGATWPVRKGVQLEAKAAAVKALSTVGTKMVPYVIHVDVSDSFAAPNNDYYEWYTVLTQNNWFVYTNGLAPSAGTKVVGSASGYSKPNYTTSCPVISGDTAFTWKARWDYRLLYSGGVFNNGVTNVTVQGTSSLDGKFDDNIFIRERSNGDYTVVGSSQLASSAANISLVQASHAANLVFWRTLAGTDKLELCNFADWPAYGATSMVGTALDQLYDGGVHENITEYLDGPRGTTAASLLNAIKVCYDACKGPKLVILRLQLASATDYARLRLWDCIAAITGSALYEHVSSGYLAEELGTISWDEKNFKLGPASAGTAGAVQWTPQVGGHYRRDFANGIVVLNLSAAPITVSLGGTFYALLGSLDPTTNNGQAVTTVTLAAKSGRVYARVTQDSIAPSAPSGLAASAVSSSTINLSWNAATDTGGSALKGYRVERSLNGTSGWTEIAQPTTASYSDTGRAGSTQYFYQVRAEDNAGNFSASYSNVANATTQGGGANTLTHGAAGILTGTGLTGISAAPIVYDDCTGNLNTIWTEAYPFNAAARAGSDVAYRTSPFTRPWGANAQPVTAPGRFTKLAAGGNDNSQADYYTYRNGFAKVFSKPAGDFTSVTRWWERLDSLYADGQRNFKIWDWALNEPYNLPNNWYIDLQPGSVPTSTSNPTYEINDDSSVGIRGTPGASGVVGNWHSTQAGHYFGGAGFNRRDTWICHEVWVRHAGSGTGRVALYENPLTAALPSSRLDTGFTVNTADGWGGSQRAIILGAYNDPSQNCWRYMQGMYIDIGDMHPYLTNSPNWSTSTIRVPQNRNGRTATEVSSPKIEGERLVAGSQIYFHARQAPWITQSDLAQSGPYILVVP